MSRVPAEFKRTPLIGIIEMEAATGIRIVAIQGTARPGNYTSKALALVIDELNQHDRVDVEVIDPATTHLALPGTDEHNVTMRVLKQTVGSATGLVLATPEYHGSFSSVMKLFIENLGFPSVLAGKPISLLGVAAGQIGAIKSLEQLRSVCSHVGAIVLPGPVSVAAVREVFDERGRCLDETIEKRIRTVATNLIEYIERHICPGVALEALVRRKSA